MQIPLLVAVSGALGALSRFVLEGIVGQRYGGAFPLGTFLVNITGSLLLGFFFTLATERFAIAPAVRSAVAVGFLGAYTTFSTLSFETFRLLEDGAYLLGALNALGSLAAGLVAIYVGVVLGRILL